MPLVSQTFDQLLDFTRTSSATFVGSNGLVQTTPASRNLLTWTQQFDNAVWAKNAATVTANSTAAPDGTSTADTLTATAGTATTPRIADVNIATVSGAVHTASLYVKAGTYTFLQIYINSQGTEWANFTLSGGGTASANGACTAAIEALSNGWYRASMSYTAGSTDRRPFFMMAASASATRAQTWNPVGTETVFIWGAQLELGSTATTYTRNNGGVFPPRFDYDPVTLAAKGLLIEEQRTNLFLRSNGFSTGVTWTGQPAVGTATGSSGISPDGTNNAFIFVPSTSAVNHDIQQAVTAAATPYTMSVYAKPAGYNFLYMGYYDGVADREAYFNVATGVVSSSVGSPAPTITAVGNGWYRCTITFTGAVGFNNFGFCGVPSNGGRAAVGNGTSGVLIYGAQFEAGAFATSYIPTVASQVTRTGDNTSIVAPNFAPWYNPSEGTFVVDFDVLVSANAVAAHALAATTASTQNNINRIWMWNGTPGLMRNTVNSGAANSAELTGATIVANTVLKAASAYRVNDFAFVTNGGTVATDTSGATPVGLTLLAIGQRGDNVEQLNGHIRSIRYYPTRLTNAQLQALTA